MDIAHLILLCFRQQLAVKIKKKKEEADMKCTVIPPRVICAKHLQGISLKSWLRPIELHATIRLTKRRLRFRLTNKRYKQCGDSRDAAGQRNKIHMLTLHRSSLTKMTNGAAFFSRLLYYLIESSETPENKRRKKGRHVADTIVTNSFGSDQLRFHGPLVYDRRDKTAARKTICIRYYCYARVQVQH